MVLGQDRRSALPVAGYTTLSRPFYAFFLMYFGSTGNHHGQMKSSQSLSIDMRVRVYPDTAQEIRGTLIEDFGELPSQNVKIDDTHIAPAARRWAVGLDNGELAFVDSEHLAPE